MTPPPSGTLPIIHAIRILHQELYVIGGKLPKRDRLGIHADMETLCLELLSLAVQAAFKPRAEKLPILETLRVKVSVAEHLIRTESELHLIDDATYLRLAAQAVEISKMANGWLNFVTQKGA